MVEQRFDRWSAGGAYERYMGRWSRAVAREFVVWTGERGPRWLDVGCGTGALSAAVVERCRPGLVVGVDRSAGFVAAARDGVRGPARFVVGDAMRLPVRDGAFDAAVSGLALNFVPGPDAALAGMARAVRPGGLVAGYVWDYAGGMGLLRHFWDAAAALSPDAVELDEGRRFAWCRPGPLRALWAGAGLVDVAVGEVEVTMVFAGFAELWEPFLAGQGPAPGYAAALPPADRRQLRDLFRAGLPVGPDGSIALSARAWAVRGRRP
ncbi:class I SAM-dependent methyltransferase [Streptomyces sp. NPDC051940]|uniref:class I SAM-dependent methyltransferase n=1 Tax=Streptomyces sp. NPDC051940 TaxID=3155675 RepID=UPI00343D8633